MKNHTSPRSWRSMDTHNVSSRKQARRELKASVTLPYYVQGLSEPIKRMLVEAEIRVRFRPNTTLRKLLVIKLKDPVPIERRTGIVYQIPCKDCSQMYVGQSGRTIVDRIKEHQQAVKNINCDRIWENPACRENAQAAQCVLLVPQVKKCWSRVFIIFMSKNLSTNLCCHLRRLTVSYKGEISLHFDLPSLYSCCTRSPLLWVLITIPASGLSRYS